MTLPLWRAASQCYEADFEARSRYSHFNFRRTVGGAQVLLDKNERH